jgi:TraG-like protein, N-terminal region
MGVNSYLEVFTTLFGWLMYEAFWNVLAGTGLVWLPVAGIILRNVAQARTSGADEGNAGQLSLKRIEVEVLGMFLVIVIAALPTYEVRLSSIQYYKPASTCSATDEVLPGDATGTTFDDAFLTLGNQVARAPLWWALVGSVSAGVTSAAVKAIPCQADLRGVSFKLNREKLTDPRLRQEIQEFTTQCFMPARAKLLRERPAAALPPDDTEWIGSNFFQSTPDYYDTIYSKTPREGFPYESPRDDGFPVGPWGYPTCNEWWQQGDPSIGLRAQIIEEFQTDVVDDLESWFGSDTREEAEDQVIKTLLRADEGGAARFEGGLGAGLGRNAGVVGTITSGATALAATAGLAFNAAAHFSKMYIVREAAPIVQALLLMVLVMLLGFLMVFSSYSIQAIAVASVAYFGIKFWTALWAVAYWVDNHMIDAMTPKENGMVAAVAYAIGLGDNQWLFNFITSMLYIVLPLAWLTLLGWAGFRVGGVFVAHQAGLQPAEAAGAGGGRLAQNVAVRYGRRGT